MGSHKVVLTPTTTSFNIVLTPSNQLYNLVLTETNLPVLTADTDMSALSWSIGVVFLLVGNSHGNQADPDKIQNEVYMITGVFGGITVILLLMVLGLSLTIARLHHQVKTVVTTSQPTAVRTVSTPNTDMKTTGPRYTEYRGPRGEEGTVEHGNINRNEQTSRQTEYHDNISYHHPQHGQGHGQGRHDYPRGED